MNSTPTLDWSNKISSASMSSELTRLCNVWDRLSAEQRQKYLETVEANPFIPSNELLPLKCSAKQILLITATEDEILYGGSAGGGKSAGMLICALQYVHDPTYHGLILRRTFQQLSKADSVLEMCKEWTLLKGASYKENTHTFTFPSGATLEFGHVEHEEDKRNYDGPSYHFVGLDEACHFSESMYLYIAFGRSRRKASSKVPIRRRLTAMPGGPGMRWVKKRFMAPVIPDNRRFIVARLEDNPFLDQEGYQKSLQNLPLFERRQLLEGDWSDFSGKYFRPDKWPKYRDMGNGYRTEEGYGQPLIVNTKRFITVDWARTVKDTSDYTAIVVWCLTPANELFILDVVNERVTMDESPRLLNQICKQWAPLSMVAGEDDVLSESMRRFCRRQPNIPEIRAMPIQSREKLQRAQAAIVWGENGMIRRPEPEPAWWDEFKTQLSGFTGDQAGHDDLVDCTALACRIAEGLRAVAYRDDDYGIEFVCPGYQG